MKENFEYENFEYENFMDSLVTVKSMNFTFFENYHIYTVYQ